MCWTDGCVELRDPFEIEIHEKWLDAIKISFSKVYFRSFFATIFNFTRNSLTQTWLNFSGGL